MTKKVDITGQKFGRLTVLSESGRTKRGGVMWECKCECNNTSIVWGSTLRNGKTTSCGCYKSEVTSAIHKIDLIGQKFGRLTVLSESGRSRGGKVLWKCKCECNHTSIVSGDRLRSGNTTSCGCYNVEIITHRNYIRSLMAEVQ